MINTVDNTDAKRARERIYPTIDRSLKDETRTLRGAMQRLADLGFAPRSVVDIGVAWGTPSIYEIFPAAYIYMIEPLETFREQLESVLTVYEGEAHFFAAGGEDREFDIWVRPDDLGRAGASLSSVCATEDRERYTIRVKPLPDIINADRLARPTLLKVDAQGHDLVILKNAGAVLDAADVVVVETVVFPFINQDDMEEPNTVPNVIAFMTAAGFQVYDIVDPLYRNHDEALAQVDIVFVRRDSPLFGFRGY